MNCIKSVAIAALLLPALSYRATAEVGNTSNGERLYRACVACHSLAPNRNMTGPSLAEVWNRKSGSLASFPRYSPALKSASSGIDDTLDEWIKDPQHFIPGNTMTFPGMKDARQRADLPFLKDAAQPGRAPARRRPAAAASSRSIIAGIPTRSPRPTGRPAISGNAICASRPMSATTARRKARRPSCRRE